MRSTRRCEAELGTSFGPSERFDDGQGLDCVQEIVRDSSPRKCILREEGKLGSNHTVKFSRGTWHHIKIREERVHREELFKSVNLTSAIRALPDSRKRHKTKPLSKKDEPAEWHGTWRQISTSLTIPIKLHFTLLLKPGQRWRPLQKLQTNKNSWLTPEHRCTC